VTGSVWVDGHPASKGSFRAVAAGVVLHDCKGLKQWQHEIASAVRCVVTAPLPGPVQIDLEFRLLRPKSHFVNGDGLRLKPHVPLYHATKPDVDKVTRAVLDGLTGALYADDGQVSVVLAAKVYLPTRDDEEGVLIAWQFMTDSGKVGDLPAALQDAPVVSPQKPCKSSRHAPTPGLTADDEARVQTIIAGLREQLPDTARWPEAKLRLVALDNLGLLPKG